MGHRLVEAMDRAVEDFRNSVPAAFEGEMKVSDPPPGD